MGELTGHVSETGKSKGEMGSRSGGELLAHIDRRFAYVGERLRLQKTVFENTLSPCHRSRPAWIPLFGREIKFPFLHRVPLVRG